MTRRLALVVVAGLMLLTGLVPAAGSSSSAATSEPAAFPQGVAAGAVRARDAVLWTRATHNSIRLEVSSSPTFAGLLVNRAVTTSAASDRTVHELVTGLKANKRYYYRFWDAAAGQYSRTGTFKTLPSAKQDVDLHFTWTGDSDGWINPATGLPAFNFFETLDRARYEGSDYFVYLGDTIYSDSSFSPFGNADTVAEYRANYLQNRTYSALRDLMASSGTYVNWDDHEVRNDFRGQTVDPTLFANGKQAFEEYFPGISWDPTYGYYRTYRMGKNVEIFILDERSFRSAEAYDDGSCNNPQPSGPPDLAPMLPQSLRNAFAGTVPQLALPVPPACIAALNDPSRTMLGDAQLDRFLGDLSASKAKFKIVFSGDPIQNQYVLPYDRWEGFLAERAAVLNHITGNGITGVVFLATDQHDNVTNDIYLDHLNLGPGSDTGIDEAIVGPIATNTFWVEVNEATGNPTAGNTFAFFQGAILGGECGGTVADINTYGWGDIDYNALTKTLTIQQKDRFGNAICDPLVLS